MLSKLSLAEFNASLIKKACGCAGVGDDDLAEHLKEAARRLGASVRFENLQRRLYIVEKAVLDLLPREVGEVFVRNLYPPEEKP